MKKSKQDIEMDYSRAIAQAEELETISDGIETATDSIADLMKNLMSSWQGDNAELFLYKGDTITVHMLNVADDLIKVAKNIRNTADIVYNAEKAALLIGL